MKKPLIFSTAAYLDLNCLTFNLDVRKNETQETYSIKKFANGKEAKYECYKYVVMKNGLIDLLNEINPYLFYTYNTLAELLQYYTEI